MTDLQVKYQDMKEKQRSNAEQERLKSYQLDLEQRKALTEKQKADIAQQEADRKNTEMRFNQIMTLGSSALDRFSEPFLWLRGLLAPTVRDLGSGASGAGSIMKGISSIIGSLG